MNEIDLFITGMTRSGTTLFEKLLCAHPALSVLSQPCPALFIEAKREFFRALGRGDEPHPLGNLFRERRYSRGELEDFLSGYRLAPGRLEQWLRSMEGYSGQFTKIADPETAAKGLDDQDLARVLAALNWRLRHRSDPRGCGSKEVLCEEFLPYLLKSGFFGILVVRDPRDVVASSVCGRGSDFVGAPRPILWTLRNWRKSVAYSLYLRDHPRFFNVRYEELALHPFSVLDPITDRLELDRFDREAFSQGLSDQEGRAWGGNSSHSERSAFDGASIGSHRQLLDDAQVRYIESVCFPELRALGYECKLDAPDLDLVRSFEDRCAARDDVPRDLARRPEEVSAELARLEAWSDPDGPGEEAASLFLYGSVARRLRDSR